MSAIFDMELKRIKLASEQKQVMNLGDLEETLTPALLATRKKLDTLLKEIHPTFPKDETVEIRKARESKINKIIDDASIELSSIPDKLFGERPKQKKRSKHGRRQ